MQVLRRQIDWKHFQTEGRLTPKECNLILGYDQQPAETQKDYLEECGPALAGLFVKILSTISVIDVIEYTLVLIDQLFSADKTPEQINVATEYFLEYARHNPKVTHTLLTSVRCGRRLDAPQGGIELNPGHPRINRKRKHYRASDECGR